MEPLILVANPGSASRKYSLYSGSQVIAEGHFEYENSHIVCSFFDGKTLETHDPSIDNINDSMSIFLGLLQEKGVASDLNSIDKIGLRIVAPSSFFLVDHIIDSEVISELDAQERRAPLHIHSELEEIEIIKKMLPNIPIIGVSDSAFHITKPDVTWNYGISLDVADKYDIKRFGYHGISVSAIMRRLQENRIFVPKVIVCHLGSGSSVTAVLDGKSVDNTMGFSPLEGLLMATRSGDIDVLALKELKEVLNLDDHGVHKLLNSESGLLGVSGISSDIRELLIEEQNGNYRAGLALRMYVLKIQQAIGRMAATLNGVDALVFTGTVGERSFIMRRRITDNLSHLGISVDDDINNDVTSANEPTLISVTGVMSHVYVMHSDEGAEIVRRVGLVKVD